jgi:pimeloyl-ACP methyl ester carboxylesterase
VTRARLVLRSLAAAAAATALVASSLSCRHGGDLATLDARTLQAPVRGEAGAALPMRATYFPPTAPRAGRRDVPLVMVEPILFRRELLYSAGRGIIPYLQAEGFPVWLVWLDAAPPPGARAYSRGIAETVATIARETGIRRFDFMGLSLGAEAALHALEPMTAPASTVEIRRVVFLGGGFDFAYPHSFAARTAGIRGGPATALCSLDGDVDCARDFNAPRAAAPLLGFLPAADEDALAPARERFSFVTRVTRVPVLFVAGKIDGIAPSESIFPLYTLWGSDAPDPRSVPKLFFLAGRENALGWEFDQLDLFAGDHAPDVWDHLARWLERND